MATQVVNEKEIIREMGDGLILRRGRAEDAEALAKLNSEVFCDRETNEPNESIAAWTRDMLTRPHPTIKPEDYTVVENSETGEPVSAMVLISQRWSYDGIEFGLGRPEIVVTRPEYRRKGLVRAQFEVMHRWSAERGELAQGITGIPYFYRQFGYEMTMELGGSRIGYPQRLPKLKDDEEEPYRMRPATEKDLGFITEVYSRGQKRYMVTCLRDEEVWRLELNGRSEKNSERRDLRIIEDKEGTPVGFLSIAPKLWGGTFWVSAYELKPGISWLAVTPSVLRYVKEAGEECAKKDEKAKLEAIGFGLGGAHPVYEAAKGYLPKEEKPYTWYMRVPDVPAFLRHIRPVLERRLAESIAAGHSGDLKLSFYRKGVKLAFKEGKLEAVEDWSPFADEKDNASAAFPGLTFLHLLFGHRTVEELRQVYPDCWAGGDTPRVLLEALFPKKPACIWPIS